MEKHGRSLHIAMFPWLVISHAKPFFELSKTISQQGHLVSFISTPQNIQVFNSTQSHLSSSVQFIALPESDPHSIENQEAFEKFLRTSDPPVDWVLFDFFPSWVSKITAKHGIQGALIALTSAVSNSFIWPEVNKTDKPKLEDLIVPPKKLPFRTTVAYKPFEARQVLNSFFEPNAPSGNAPSESQSMCSSIIGCEVVAIRSCFELEPEWLGIIPQLYNKPVLPLSLLLPSISKLPEDQTLKWLDQNEIGSVVYVAFGSQLYLNQEEVREVAHALEISNLPFVWALRSPKGGEPIKLPDGFEDRTRHRGMICKSWVPQIEILAHPSVGGFMTHCGWNSVLEALRFGVALALFPIANDAGLNTRYLAEQKLGIEIPRNEMDGSFVSNDMAKTLRLIMVDEEGSAVRARVKELKSIFGRKELHDEYVRKFVTYLEDNQKK